jgi:hypothetical protein
LRRAWRGAWPRCCRGGSSARLSPRAALPLTSPPRLRSQRHGFAGAGAHRLPERAGRAREQGRALRAAAHGGGPPGGAAVQHACAGASTHTACASASLGGPAASLNAPRAGTRAARAWCAWRMCCARWRRLRRGSRCARAALHSRPCHRRRRCPPRRGWSARLARAESTSCTLRSPLRCARLHVHTRLCGHTCADAASLRSYDLNNDGRITAEEARVCTVIYALQSRTRIISLTRTAAGG